MASNNTPLQLTPESSNNDNNNNNNNTSTAPNLFSSGITIPSDSENYDASASSPPSSSSSPLILYKPPTLWGLVRGAAINLLLPFVNGLMLGFGELVANEVAFRLGWSGTKVRDKEKSVLDEERALWADDVQTTDLSYASFGCAPRGAWRGDAGRPRRAEAEEWRGNGRLYGFGVGTTTTTCTNFFASFLSLWSQNLRLYIERACAEQNIYTSSCATESRTVIPIQLNAKRLQGTRGLVLYSAVYFPQEGTPIVQQVPLDPRKCTSVY